MLAFTQRAGGRRSPAGATIGLVVAALLAACGGDSTSPTATTNTSLSPATVNALSGNGQSGSTGAALAQSLVVQVSTSSGALVQGATVNFDVTSGSATLSASSATTDATGQARTSVTLGTSAGSVTVVATVKGTALTTTFTLTALDVSAPTADCTPTTLGVGEAAVQSGASVCVGGGSSGAEYALVSFNAATDASSRASLVVNAAGVDATTSALSNAAPSGGAFGTLGASASVSPRDAFELKLRATARAELAPKVDRARSWYASRSRNTSLRLNAIPGTVSVGSLVSLNANADDACTRPAMHAARVMAVGTKALVVADTLNPTGGYTTADYQSIAATFDTLVDAIDTKNFGQPTDIDGNGHVILFFTSAVNALTPKGADYYIGGFFYDRDLFPTTATRAADACPSSNVAEMFYLMVPDPNGTINGNVFSKSFVTNAAIGTTAHEYQHLINASRRLYVNNASDFEETWLDEGLAHTAEELVFYGRAGLTPLANIDATKLRSNTTYRAAFNNEGIDNFGRLWDFLSAPSVNSPYADNDSLATRGATWSFLRYAVDHQATTADAQASVLSRIVNSTTTGLANLRNVFGSDLTPLLRDWATTLLLDDVSGAGARYLEPSWNLRSIFDALSTSGTYPLATTSLSSATPTTLSVAGGGAAYLRFTVGAGKTGAVSWTTGSSTVVMTLVRLR